MTIQRTTAPGGVAKLLTLLPFSVTLARAEFEQKSLKTSTSRTFWQKIISGAAVEWPAVANTTIRIGQVAGGFLFMLEDAQGLLVLGAGGLSQGGMAWLGLCETVLDIRQQIASTVQDSPGGPELIASWEEPIPPTAEPWLVLVPMMGMRYYTPDAERILLAASETGADLLAIGDLGALPENLS